MKTYIIKCCVAASLLKTPNHSTFCISHFCGVPFSNKPNPNFYIILTTYDNNIKDDEKGYK